MLQILSSFLPLSLHLKVIKYTSVGDRQFGSVIGCVNGCTKLDGISQMVRQMSHYLILISSISVNGYSSWISNLLHKSDLLCGLLKGSKGLLSNPHLYNLLEEPRNLRSMTKLSAREILFLFSWRGFRRLWNESLHPCILIWLVMHYCSSQGNLLLSHNVLYSLWCTKNRISNGPKVCQFRRVCDSMSGSGLPKWTHTIH